MIIYIASQIPVITVINYLLYFAFILVSLIIITGIHILAAAASVYYVESENLIWAYREAMAMGRLPQEVFPAGIQLIFTFIMPIFLMITFPAKILLGILSFKAMIFMIVYAVIFLPFSLFVWNISLKHYSSASS
jgi:ABC-2 type transport system permease protein